MKTQKITALDIPRVIELFKIAFPSAWKKTGRKFNANFVSGKIRKALKTNILVKVEQKGELIGFGWAGKEKDFLGNPYGDIKLILVHPQYQNKRVGSKLLTYLEKSLKTKDLRLFVLAFNPAKKLYRQKGYADFGIQLRKIT